jgi:hypothetical protein
MDIKIPDHIIARFEEREKPRHHNEQHYYETRPRTPHHNRRTIYHVLIEQKYNPICTLRKKQQHAYDRYFNNKRTTYEKHFSNKRNAHTKKPLNVKPTTAKLQINYRTIQISSRL